MQKHAIYERYKEGLSDLPVSLNPYETGVSTPNFWLSCMVIDEASLASHNRGEKDEVWRPEAGKSSPGEILAALAFFNAEGRPIWKPMHMQPIYRENPFVTREENGFIDVSADVFRRGLCLPSDNKMTEKEQEKVIDIIHRCFDYKS